MIEESSFSPSYFYNLHILEPSFSTYYQFDKIETWRGELNKIKKRPKGMEMQSAEDFTMRNLAEWSACLNHLS